MFLKVLDPEQIDHSRIKSIIVNESGTFIHAEDDYRVVNDDYEPITEEEWREQSPPVPESIESHEPAETIEPHEPAETIEQKLTRLESQNIILMDALATTFEELIALRELVEGGTK
jgi:hypothetical protein